MTPNTSQLYHEIQSSLLPHAIEQPKLTATENPLSSREQEVLTLMANGETNQQIADNLAISATTVKSHLRKLIIGKLDVHRRTQAIVEARARH